MKVTQVSLIPTEAAKDAGRPALTPELLAASGARYSRNNEGLEAILSKIDPNNLDKSVDGIFKMIDYGHQSIADMAPVAMFMDGMSIFLAYYIWSLCATAGGQESSTRYIRMDMDGLLDPEKLGVKDTEQWRQDMQQSFDAYNEAVALWEELSIARPELMRIPSSLLNDESDKAQKQVARMRRNYAFDRARVFLPVAAATNVMMVQSARAWVSLSAHLLSHPLPEMQKLGGLIRDELELAAPRLVKHARFTESTRKVLEDEFEAVQNLIRPTDTFEEGSFFAANPTCYVDTMWAPTFLKSPGKAQSLTHRANRYSLVGSELSRMAIRFGWAAVAIAEIRDLNRHRTGTKYCPLCPMGFYAAEEQVPEDMKEMRSRLIGLAQKGALLSMKAKQMLKDGDWAYVYSTLLGTQYPFEHVTTVDKFIYQAELRTGVGAHYRYAKHMRDVLQEFYKVVPESKGLILEGSAEPE